jgi:hypothetical protein
MEASKKQDRIFISLSPEVQELLADNEIDLVSELQNRGLDVEGEHGRLPGGDVRTKDVTLIILASAAVIGTLGMTIANILDAIGRNRKALVTEKEWVPVVSPNGEVVRDANGDPMLQWVEKHRLLEAQQTAQAKSTVEVSAGGDKLLDIKLTSG